MSSIIFSRLRSQGLVMLQMTLSQEVILKNLLKLWYVTSI